MGLKYDRARKKSPEPWSCCEVIGAEWNMGNGWVPFRARQMTKPGKTEKTQTLSEGQMTCQVFTNYSTFPSLL